MSRPLRSALAPIAVVAACLLAGCSLPMESGVRVPDGSAGDEQLLGAEQGQGRLAPLPAGPQPGESPTSVVNGFLQAQRSAEDDHAIARRFLAPEIRDSWNDDAQVKVYENRALQRELIGDPDGDAVQVRLRGTATATISADGSYDPQATELDETYGLRRDEAGNWVLTDVPPGLRLTPVEVARSYASLPVYYLARGTGPGRYLVPDPALLLVETDPVAALVQRLVASRSGSLSGAVDTAVPAGAEVRTVSTDSAGLVTVDLGPKVAQLPPQERQWLSAQLVWTLRGAGPSFAGLRLLSDGQPVDVPGVQGEVQDRTAWQEYDPDGLSEQTTTYYLADRRVHVLERIRPLRSAADIPVDLAAVSPRTDDLALLTEIGADRQEVRIGDVDGPVPSAPVYTGDGLRSPSWGSGRRGLWLLQAGPEPQLLLLDRAGQAVPVPIPDPPPGQLTALQVSRDGARIALVAGQDAASRKVYVAQVIDDAGGLRIGAAREIGFGVSNVSDVAWESATSIVALGEFESVAAPLPLRLTIDGSGRVERVSLPGLEQVAPESLAAAPDRPLVVSATRDGRQVLFRSTGQIFAPEPVTGYAPFYPG